MNRVKIAYVAGAVGTFAVHVAAFGGLNTIKPKPPEAQRVAVMARGKLVTSGTVDEIRAHVSRKQVSLVSKLPPDVLRGWPEVLSLSVERDRLQITTRTAEALLQRLFREDPSLTDIEVRRAGLAEAFSELTNDNPEVRS